MDNIFAVNLKNLRIEKGLNQTELAEKLFINKSMISSYEKGTRMPSLDILMQLTFIFNVSIDYITGITNIKYGKNNMNTEEKNLLERWNCLTEKNKGKAEYFFEQLLKKQLRSEKEQKKSM